MHPKLKLLILFLTLNSNIHCNFNEILNKFILFYLSQLTATIGHESGHALVAKLRGKKPQIFIGGNSKNIEKNCEYNSINFLSANPNIGFTKSKSIKKQNANHDILQTIIGPIFGILTYLIQYSLVNKFENKLGYNLSNSLRMFIMVNIIQHTVYGFTPFDQINGDGTKFLHKLYLKKIIPTNLSEYIKPFDQLKLKFFEYYASYQILRLFIKLIGKTEMLNLLDKKLDNKVLHAILCYLNKYESALMIQTLNESIDDAYEKTYKEKKNNSNIWLQQLLADCYIF